MRRGSVPRYAACCDVSSGLTEPAGLSTWRCLWCRCCGQSVCGLTEVFCDLVDVVVRLSHLPLGSGWHRVINCSSLPLKSWSLHSFGLWRSRCSLTWVAWCAAPWGTMWLLYFYSTAPAAWTFGQRIVYFSLRTMHLITNPWLSVMFGLYTVLFLVFFSFCCVHVLIWKALWALNRRYIH